MSLFWVEGDWTRVFVVDDRCWPNHWLHYIVVTIKFNSWYGLSICLPILLFLSFGSSIVHMIEYIEEGVKRLREALKAKNFWEQVKQQQTCENIIFIVNFLRSRLERKFEHTCAQLPFYQESMIIIVKATNKTWQDKWLSDSLVINAHLEDSQLGERGDEIHKQ